MLELTFKPRDRVWWDCAGLGTIVSEITGLSGFYTVRFDDPVPREYSTSNPCCAMAKDLRQATPDDEGRHGFWWKEEADAPLLA